jgi:cytochrome P450
VHLCVGAPLARLALRLVFSELFVAAEQIELVDPPERLASNFVAGIKRMRVNIVPRRSGQISVQ